MSNAWWLWLAAGYLAGSIPFGLLIGRLKGVDLRDHGSRNIGATNTGRVLGRTWGVVCLLLDVAKGAGPVVAAGLVMGWWGRVDLGPAEAARWLAIMVTPVVGHVFPVWLKFKGGKGVATSLGALVAFWPLLTVPAAIALVAWALALAIGRYVGMASVVAAAVLPLATAGWCTWREVSESSMAWLVGAMAMLAALVVVRHRGNLARWWAGTEPKIGGHKKKPGETAETPAEPEG